MKTLRCLIVLLLFVEVAQCQDMHMQSAIKLELGSKLIVKTLNYPKSVKRFYASKIFMPAWINANSQAGQTFEAMLLLECVSQYGLNHADYHPKKLTYDILSELLNKDRASTSQQKASFDIALTDALITLINHLHFGKFNPKYTQIKIDNEKSDEFSSEKVLLIALKSSQFVDNILNVQPKIKAYADLQSYMRLIRGQNSGDCYETPESEVKKIGINMERLRWADFKSENYIHVNIPSFSLHYQQGDSTYSYKVIVGKPKTKSPALESQITSFTVAPDRLVSMQILKSKILPKGLKNSEYFRQNRYTIYNRKGKPVEANNSTLRAVKNNPEKYMVRQSSGIELSMGTVVFNFESQSGLRLFEPSFQNYYKATTVTNGSIGVLKAEELAALILKYDGSEGKVPEMRKAVKAYQQKEIILRTSIPLKVTYLTCMIQNGLPVFYKDIYNLDESLENVVYKHQADLKTNIY
jgi:murein L,D-transpeptidase YcbB/YkuD